MASESEALQKLKARVKFLEEQQSNRWAAFTNDELEGLAGYDHDVVNGSMGDRYLRLYVEVEAELERRRA